MVIRLTRIIRLVRVIRIIISIRVFRDLILAVVFHGSLSRARKYAHIPSKSRNKVFRVNMATRFMSACLVSV